MSVTVLWFVLPLIAVSLKLMLGPAHYNNFLIYTQVYHHLAAQVDLYAFYPGEHLYQNHYGPSFALLIAPFAVLPNAIGGALWVLAGSATLYLALSRLPVSLAARAALMSIVLVEMTGSLQNQQFNTMLCAWIILAWNSLRQGRVWPAAFLISGGILIKLYGVVGVLFTPFTGRYRRMMLAMAVAMLVLICLPMFFSSPSFVLGSYESWYARLLGKNAENIHTNLTDGMQDLSAMGMFRRITGLQQVSNAWFLIPAGMLMLLPLSRRSHYTNPRFQLTYLAQLLIGLVVFSTSAESPTYVIAVTGCAIWFTLYLPKPPAIIWGLLALLVLLTILPPTDIFPRQVKKAFVSRYALKALPCVTVWFVITWELLFGRHFKTNPPHVTPGITPGI